MSNGANLLILNITTFHNCFPIEFKRFPTSPNKIVRNPKVTFAFWSMRWYERHISFKVGMSEDCTSNLVLRNLDQKITMRTFEIKCVFFLGVCNWFLAHFIKCIIFYKPIYKNEQNLLWK